MRIIYFVEDKLGGITSLNQNLIKNRLSGSEEQWVIRVQQLQSSMTKAESRFNAEKEIPFKYSITENRYAIIERLYSKLPKEAGVLVLNDGLEMEMLDHFEVSQTVYQIVHDDYNLQLAINYHNVVDVFIAHSRFFYDQLVERLPTRIDNIFYLPHGVPIPAFSRKPLTAGLPIRLLFLGRMTGAKGIFDLPVISQHLQQMGIPFSWTCIGNGPELQKLKDEWRERSNLTFASPNSPEEVLQICADHDVFVLPTKFEGSPVSLLETLSVGLVPVITDLPGGIREIVDENIGFRVEMDNNAAFANAISRLSADRSLLNTLSANCRRKVEKEFNVKHTAAKYHELFLKYEQFYKVKQRAKRKLGARLDHPLIPSAVTRTIRSLFTK